MTQIINHLGDIIQDYDAIFCDVWGVIHNGKSAFPDAVEALMQARLQKKWVSLVTNSPKTPSSIQGQVGAMNVPDTAYDDIVSAGFAMQYSLFTSDYKKFYFIGREEDRILLTDLPEGVENHMSETTDYKEADVILCAGPDYGHKDSPDDYTIELRQLATRKLPMFCGNPDIMVDHGEKRIWCGGAIAAAYEEMGGTVYQFGKPFPPIYQLARERMQSALGRNIAPERILFIGDGIATDLKGAILEDMDALFVSSGLAAKETGTHDGAPDPAMLESYLMANSLDPRFTIGKLRW